MDKSINLAKIAFGFALVVLAFAFAVMPAAAAFSASQQAALEAAGFSSTEIAALGAILGGDDTGSSESCEVVYNHTQTLASGATGDSVMDWQTFLNVHANQSLSTDGVYGPATAAATQSFQSSHGLSADGVVGPNTASVANDVQTDCPDQGDDDDDDAGSVECPAGFVCTPSGDDDDDDDDDSELEGNAGNINDADFISSLNNEEIGEGQDDVEVAGLEVEAGNDSDIRLRAVQLDFAQNSAGSDFEDYASEVSLWFDGEEIARVDADEFDDDNDYSRTVSVDGGIIRAGDTEDLVVAVSGINNLDSADEGDSWDVSFGTVRFEDGQGAIISENSQGDIGGETRTFSFESFASASNVEFKISSGDDDINDARVIDVDSSDETDDVELFSFEVEIEGNSDVELKDLPINASLSSLTNLNDLFSGFTLMMDGDEVASENASTGTEIVFEDIDTWLDAGETYEFVLRGDVLETDSGSYTEGETASFAFGENETDDADFDAEDEEGDNLADSDKTGSSSSDAHGFYDNGIEVVAVNEASTTLVPEDGATNDSVEFKFELEIENFGDTDVYLTGENGNVLDTATANTLEVIYAIEKSSGADLTDVSETIVASGVDTVTGDTGAYGGDYSGETFFVLESGETETFSITITGKNQTDSKQVRAYLSSLEWTTDDVTDDSGDVDGDADDMNSYTFQLQDDTETPYKLIN